MKMQLQQPLVISASFLFSSASGFTVDPAPPAATGGSACHQVDSQPVRVPSLVQHLIDATRMENPNVSGGALPLGLYSGTTACPLLNSSPELPKNDWVEPNTDPELPTLPDVKEPDEPAPVSAGRWNLFKGKDEEVPSAMSDQTDTKDVTEEPAKNHDIDEVPIIQKRSVLPIMEKEEQNEKEEEETTVEPLPAPSMESITGRVKSRFQAKKLEEAPAAVVEDDEETAHSETVNVPSFEELKEQFETFCNEPFTPGQWVLQYLPPDTTLTNGSFMSRFLLFFIVASYLASSQYQLSRLSRTDDVNEAKRKQEMDAKQMDDFEKEEAEARKMAAIFSKDDSYEAEDSAAEDDGLEDVLTVMEEIDEEVFSKTGGQSSVPDSTKDPKLYSIDEEDGDEESEGETISMSDEESTLQHPPTIQRADVQPFPKIDESSVPSREASDEGSEGSGSLVTNCPTGKEEEPNPAAEEPTTPSKKKRNFLSKLKSPKRRPKSPRRWRNKQKTA